jgi:hypothetical protein
MADTKLSQLPVATAAAQADLIPILSGGANKCVTRSVLFTDTTLNGSHKVSVSSPTSLSIPLNTAVCNLTATDTYTLGLGSENQLLTIISSVSATVSGTINATFSANGTLQLLFISGSWFVLSARNVTLA